MSLYEKENVYLAEAAHFLQRLVQYEISALRRHINRAENGVQVNVWKCLLKKKRVGVFLFLLNFGASLVYLFRNLKFF